MLQQGEAERPGAISCKVAPRPQNMSPVSYDSGHEWAPYSLGWHRATSRHHPELSQSSKEVFRTASHHLDPALAPVSFGSCVLPSGVGGVGTALFRPQDPSVGRAGASGRRDAWQADTAGDYSRVRNPERIGSAILSGLTHCARTARWPWRWPMCMEPRQLWG